MQGVLAENTKVVVSDRNGNNVLYLPLDKKSAPAANARAAADFVERMPPVQATLPARDAYRDPRDTPRSGRDGGRP
jgi:hypothetical protein